MHAYLLIGQTTDNLQQTTENLAKKLHAKIMEFPLVKIDDVRSLNNLIRLSFNEPTLIVCQNIHEAGEEALNAFLKNLEEPQENIFFALSAPSVRKVLPTIASRCQIIKVKKSASSDAQKLKVKSDDMATEFMKMTTGEKLAFIDKIKDRDKAIEFAENLVNFLHNRLHSDKIDYAKTAKNLETVSQALVNLKANGNVSLQLTNMTIGLP